MTVTQAKKKKLYEAKKKIANSNNNHDTKMKIIIVWLAGETWQKHSNCQSQVGKCKKKT